MFVRAHSFSWMSLSGGSPVCSRLVITGVRSLVQKCWCLIRMSCFYLDASNRCIVLVKCLPQVGDGLCELGALNAKT